MVFVRRFPLVAVLIALGVWPATASADAPVPSELPPATYPATYTQQQFITMDDGVQLGATITFPSNDGSAPAPGRFPVVLSMTPYGRNGLCGCGSPSDFATRGFVSAVVDVRGTGGSQGNLDGNYFSPREAQDGYDLVEYLGTRSWSAGRVGMSGGSYVGITQYKSAELDPPHLAAIAPDVSLADIYNDAAYPGGILSLSFDAQYLAVQGAPGLAGPNTDPSMIPGTLTAKYDQATGRSIAFDYLEHPFNDPFYASHSPITQVANIRVPVFVEDGWRDAFSAGDIRMFQALQSRPGVATYLNVGPCTHKGCGGLAPTDNPPGQDNVEAQEIRFDQRYLMGMNVPSLPRVRLYDQQGGQYLDTTAWPPPQSTFQREYLGTDTLSPEPAPTSDRSYFTNPAAGTSMSLDEQGTVAITPYLPTDQRLEDQQGLTWRTSPVAQPLTLAGPTALHLVAASTATNTDWFAKISDVAPDGSESIVTEGQLRASLRGLASGSTEQQPLETLTTPQPLSPGQFYDYEIALAPTAYQFAAGHRLQLRLTSDNMPNALPGTLHFNSTAPAASTFEPLPPATNTVRSGGADGTSLLLPVYGAAQPPTGPQPQPQPQRRGCPLATGRLRGRTLGPVRLGMTRARARRAFKHSSTRGHRYLDFFCLTPNGVRVGYSSPGLLRALKRSERKRLQGRVVIALTANPHYALRGVHPGARLGLVAALLRPGHVFNVGLNRWYLAPNGPSTGVLKVRHGIIEEVGIATKRLVNGRTAARRLLRSFS
ncbi:MAG: CocE/NonD family hydrolase [Solirubrobacteraceae bacterium]